MSAASEPAAAGAIGREARPALGYVPGLDGLRAVAVLMVLAFHGNLSWARGGFLGVDVFFVLSGFLISRLLLEERARGAEIALGRFYLRRALRLFPALAVLLVVHVAAALLWLEEPQRGWVLSDVWTCASYQINWWRAFAPRAGLALSPLDHTWSLAAEEQFYLVWPLALVALARLGGVRAVAVGAALGALASVLRGVQLFDADDFHRAYFGLDAHAHGLLIGAAFAAAAGWSGLPPRADGALRIVGPLALVGILACGVLARLNQAALQYGGYVAFALATLLVLRDVLGGGLLARALAWAPLVYVGRVSYALYLWHAPLLWALRFGAPSLDEHARLAIYLLGSLALAALSHRFVEQPFLRLKRRFAAAPGAAEQRVAHAI